MNQNPNGFIRLKGAMLENGLGKTSIYRRMLDGTFPQCVKLGPRAVGWRRGDLDTWLADPSGFRARTFAEGA